MDFTDRIHLIRSGVPAQVVGVLALVMNVPPNVLMRWLGLFHATVNCKGKTQRVLVLSPGESE